MISRWTCSLHWHFYFEIKLWLCVFWGSMTHFFARATLFLLQVDICLTHHREANSNRFYVDDLYMFSLQFTERNSNEEITHDFKKFRHFFALFFSKNKILLPTIYAVILFSGFKTHCECEMILRTAQRCWIFNGNMKSVRIIEPT